jgi:phage repressor protein C with HTH and peptisase S24 domain
MTMPQPFVDGGRTITVLGNSMMPLYRHGDRLIVSDKLSATIGDRIVVESSTHGTLGGTLLHRDENCITVMLGGKTRREVLVRLSEVEFLGRIVWASQ